MSDPGVLVRIFCVEHGILAGVVREGRGEHDPHLLPSGELRLVTTMAEGPMPDDPELALGYLERAMAEAKADVQMLNFAAVVHDLDRVTGIIQRRLDHLDPRRPRKRSTARDFRIQSLDEPDLRVHCRRCGDFEVDPAEIHDAIRSARTSGRPAKLKVRRWT